MQTAARAPLCSLLFSGVFDGANEDALARKDKPRAKTIPVNRPEHHVFACNEYNDEQKMKLAAAEFSHYALTWWNKYQREKVKYEEPMVNTWTRMKRIMRKRYLPASYNRDLQLKLQRMTQGNKSVEEYFKEMEVTMIRAGKNEENEAIMARFLNGLNHDIRDVVELQEYVDMCTALVVGCDDVASCYNVGVLTRRQVGKKGRKSGGTRSRQLLSWRVPTSSLPE